MGSQLVHNVGVTRDDCGNKLPIRSMNTFKVAGLLSLRRGHRSEQQSDHKGIESVIRPRVRTPIGVLSD